MHTPVNAAGSPGTPNNSIGGSPVSPSAPIPIPNGAQKKVESAVSSSSFSSSPSSSSPEKPNKIRLTSMEGVAKTIDYFHEFVVVLQRSILAMQANKEGGEGVLKKMPHLDLEELNNVPKEREKKDHRKVSDNRGEIQKRAEKHQTLLTHYRAYLRLILEELGHIKLTAEFNELESMVNGRGISAPQVTSSSSLTKSSTQEAKFHPCLQEAWNKLGTIGQLKGELESLKNKYGFIGNGSLDDELAKECRLNESSEFRERLFTFTCDYEEKVDDKMKEWEREELKKVKKVVEDSLASFIETVLSSKCLPDNTSGKISTRVKSLSEEFDGTMISDQVMRIRNCYQRIRQLKEIISTENSVEYLRGEDRSKLHISRLVEMIKLKESVGKLDVEKTIEALNSLRDSARKQKDSVRKVFEYSTEILALYDKEKEKKDKL